MSGTSICQLSLNKAAWAHMCITSWLICAAFCSPPTNRDWALVLSLSASHVAGKAAAGGGSAAPLSLLQKGRHPGQVVDVPEGGAGVKQG
eukprot:scaffold66573_cov19-Tisochrysis_lutea.AAC.1